VAGHNDFIARPNTLQLVQEINNHGPRAAQNALRRARMRGKLLFKLLRFFAEDVLA
jgi:hypothetical protein